MEKIWQIEIRPQAEGPITALAWVKAVTSDDALNYIKRSDAKAYLREGIAWPGFDDEFVCWA